MRAAAVAVAVAEAAAFGLGFGSGEVEGSFAGSQITPHGGQRTEDQ